MVVHITLKIFTNEQLIAQTPQRSAQHNPQQNIPTKNIEVLKLYRAYVFIFWLMPLNLFASCSACRFICSTPLDRRRICKPACATVSPTTKNKKHYKRAEMRDS